MSKKQNSVNVMNVVIEHMMMDREVIEKVE